MRVFYIEASDVHSFYTFVLSTITEFMLKKKMKIMLKIMLLAAVVLSGTAFAQNENVFVFNTKSPSMQKEIPATIVLPDSYKTQKEAFPVIYLLHGHGGNHAGWAKHTQPQLQKLASQHNLIFVCPDGANSWYWDSPIDPKLKYETYITKELIPQIDAKFNTVKNRKGRAIIGFSMGGHGALYLAINHQDLFGACGSLSGGVDIRPFPNNWHMANSLGEYSKNKAVWDSHTVMEQLYKIKPNSLAITIDCGVKDFFYKVNEELHQKLLYLNIPHDYTTRPGAHTHEYWGNAIRFQTVFFDEYFKKQNVKK